MCWVVLAYSLPTGSTSSPRVAIWRRLRRLGSVAPVGSLYVLPFRDIHLEAMQWLAVEIRDAGGDALVLTGEAVSGLSNEQIVQAFNRARDEDYAELSDACNKLVQEIEDNGDSDDFSDALSKLARLRARYNDVRAIDYFGAPAGVEFGQRLDGIHRRYTTIDASDVTVVERDRSLYQGRTWLTRPKPHVDRLASIWLIQRFVDDKPTFRFGMAEDDDDVTFDMEDAEFGHVGNLCTFEVLIRSFALDDRLLTTLAEVVHQADLWDDVYPHPWAPGVDATLRGWRASNVDDSELVERGMLLFDGLYHALGEARQADRNDGPE